MKNGMQPNAARANKMDGIVMDEKKHTRNEKKCIQKKINI